MPQPKSTCISRDQYDAVLFDLDGVITDTANLHATSWKQMFDEYLQKRAQEKGKTFVRSISLQTTGSMSMESLVSMAFVIS